MKFHSFLLGVFVILIAGSANSVMAGKPINVLTEKGGKVVLVVDDESVRKEAGGKVLLVIDGPSILTEKGGKRLFFMDGDILHTEPEGPVCAYRDGRHVLSKPGGKELFYINGKEIKPDRDGKVLYYVDGEDLNNQQLMAALYTLRPDLIQRPADGAAPAPAPAEAPAAKPDPGPVKDLEGGIYSISAYHSSDASKHAGKVTIKKIGEMYAMDLQFTDVAAWQGVAVQNGDEFLAAIGPVNTVGLVDYTVTEGVLNGVWMNAGGDKKTFGLENLSGEAGLKGSYKITSARAPFTRATYGGTAEISALPKAGGDAGPAFYHLGWDLSGYKVQGVAVKSDKHLVGATSTGADCAIVRFKIDAKGNLTGEFYSVTKATGDYTLTKDAQ